MRWPASAYLSTDVVISLQRETVIEEHRGETLPLIAQETLYLADKLCNENSGTVSDVTCARSLARPLPLSGSASFFQTEPVCLPATNGSPLNQKTDIL